MAKMFWIDVPRPFIEPENYDNRWINIAQVKTREDARALMQDRYGILLSDEQLDVFITQGDDMTGEVIV